MNPPSTDVERAEERDAELIDRLYGEDAPGSNDDLGDLRAVRALVARVRDEAPVAEPSPAIAATLLAAARARAPREGPWARFVAWMSPVTSHPGLAAAATLVVVAGAAALWMRGGGEVAEPKAEAPEVRSQAEAPAAGPTVEEPVADPGFEADVATPEPAKEEGEPKGGKPPADIPPEKPVRKSSPAKANQEREEKRLETTPDKRADVPVVVTGRVDGQVGSGGGAASGGDADKKKKAPVKDEAPPPAPPPPEEAPSPSDDGGDGEAVTVTDTAQTERRDSSKDQARAVTRKARAEAEQNNCKNTTSYGTQVSNLDRAIYDKEFVKDRFIDACLRRARSKQTTGSGP